MARDQEPMTEGDLENAKEAIQELREETREALAEELGGEANDFRADTYRDIEADGGKK